MPSNKYIYLYQDKVLLNKDDQWLQDELIAASFVPWQSQPLFIATINGSNVYLQVLEHCIEIINRISPRELFVLINEQEFALLTKAMQLNHWLRNHYYCGRCGNKTQINSREYGLSCQACEYTQYPRLSPCIIVAITGPKGLLLGRGKHFSAGRYSTLAGFVEVGETVEEAVHREVFEEVSVKVDQLEYMFSQSWPFPHSLMLGYLAHYHSGDIHVDGEEIEDAQWFNVDNLPDLPGNNTIARKLIDLALQRL